MNRNRGAIEARRNHRWESGQSYVELAIFTVALALVLLAGADLSRLFYVSIAVDAAARAGAQYGSQSVITAADFKGMEAAARTDGANVSGLSATATQCTCESSPIVAACPAAYCANDAQATFVEVDAQAAFKTLMDYPGFPSSLTVKGEAIMQVQQ